ncbi:MAG: helix-turn-helix transcriptional regulator [Firmicutes bacterium]|nr:helix-turn-helix transcriptional regulator [Bacillota bacterium]
MYQDKIKGRMAELHISRVQLAEILNLSPQGLGLKLNGTTEFTIKEARILIKALKISNPNAIFFNNIIA